MMPQRPSWDAYFMEIARTVSTRATCLRRSVGAVIEKDRRILTTGYNGAPRGVPHCEEFGCDITQRCQLAAHAEQNAIAQAALNGVSCEGASLYVTCQPCSSCAKMLINAGIRKIVFEGDYPDELALTLFRLAGVELYRFVSGKLEPVFETV
ncbi:MAG TPA: dCMP deaminase family protein [Fimbriimonadales bacterium]|nr:dCMP deaminase family protein [Fimbriimonadales bacterium]